MNHLEYTQDKENSTYGSQPEPKKAEIWLWLNLGISFKHMFYVSSTSGNFTGENAGWLATADTCDCCCLAHASSCSSSASSPPCCRDSANSGRSARGLGREKVPGQARERKCKQEGVWCGSHSSEQSESWVPDAAPIQRLCLKGAYYTYNTTV